MEFLPKKPAQCQTENKELIKDIEAYRPLDQNSYDRRFATTDLPNVYVCRRTPDWYSASQTTLNNATRQTPFQRTILNKSNSEWKNVRDNTTQCQNPILDSPQYQAYRARQEDSDACDEKKWPPDLEGFFLDGTVTVISFATITDLIAMMDIPPMGRQKYTFNGKPHGRNELIALYIWIAYRESLPSGVAPSPLMIRHRKQISSHIQVLKKYLQGHSAFSLIFPPIEMIPESGYPLDSNPCLVALSQGRLPNKRYRDYIRARYRSQFGQQIHNDSLDVAITPLPTRPAMVSLAISIPLPRVLWRETLTSGDTQGEQVKGHAIFVQFKSALSIQSKDDTLESIPRWREKFPRLLMLPVPETTDYAIIHIHVLLDLSPKIGQNEMESSNQIILSIPNIQPDNCECRVLTTLTQSFEIPDDPRVDGSVEVGVLQGKFYARTPTDSQIMIPFPTHEWAKMYSWLYNFRTRSTKRTSNSFPQSINVEHLSMYQEVYCNSGPATPFKKQATLLWTFQHVNQNNRNCTSWRNVTMPPSYLLHSIPAMRHQTRPKSSDLSVYPWQHHLPIDMGLEAGFLSRSEMSAPSVVGEQVPNMNGHNFYQNNRQLSHSCQTLQGSEDCSIIEFDMTRPMRDPNFNSQKYQENHPVNWNLSGFYGDESIGEALSSNGKVTPTATLDWMCNDLRVETPPLTWDYITES
ncbi:BgtA-20401 [Blumeria graminis f. sp. tritici]|uniref:BgtA-20401 n=1 Tax=Blumeria graminis f. sp. tritici TaxID=62690 RepID=A0A9X9L9N3_BLUGR|nr:BgtA-20401 [Blumeria graminis f. sp. tritici]